MKYSVVFLQQAELDLKELKNYMTHHFSRQAWTESYEKIKKSVNSLKIFPQAGIIPPELQHLGIDQYRQIISGMNRIIYEIRQHSIYIHLVCDARRDLTSMLTARLLRSASLCGVAN